MYGAHRAHGRCKKYIHFNRETLKRRDHLGDLGIAGRIILKLISKK
jgi:hypothetical protein